MKIDDFLLQKQPLNKLVAAYIELEQVYNKEARLENRRKETLFLNSILVSVATKQATAKTLWNEIKYCLEVNSNDRACLSRGAQLLTQVFKRNSQSLQTAQHTEIEEIIIFSCQKALITICGNDFISLIEHVTSRLSLASDLKSTVPAISNLLVSNKLQVNTYRQQTRLCLYKILLRLLDLPKEHDSQFLEKCVQAGEGQKDPRNIGAVFELYLKILSIFPTERLAPFKAAMFQNIEAYYPIEFVGDEDNQEHRKVNFAQISQLLDQCLCHPFFSELSWQLLSSKTAAPPLAPFISTILAFFRSLRKNPSPSLSERLSNLLFRFSEEEFIAEEYEQHAAQDLSTVIQGLLDVIFCREDGTYSVEAYGVVKKWLDQTLKKVTTGELHHSGTMMGLFRAIINRSHTPRFAALVELLRYLSLKAILKTISDGEIIPKLGLAVVVVTSADQASEDVKELIGLLVLKIGSLYSQVSDEIKLLLLKILLQVYKGSEGNRLMVRKVNDGLILKDIVARAQTVFSIHPNENQAFMVKAFIDFVATVYINQIDLLLNQVTGLNFELEGYLLGRLWETASHSKEDNAEVKIVSKLNQLIKILTKEEDGDELVKGLRVVSKSLLLKLVLAVNWQKEPQHQQLLFSILLALRSNINTSNFDPRDFQSKENKTGLSQVIFQFFLTNNQQNLAISKEEKLWRALRRQQTNSITFPLMKQIENYNIDLPFLQKFRNAYPPTFIQWLWQQLKGSEKSETRSKRLGEILRWLPEPLLLRDKKEVLELILSDNRCTSSLLKIAKHIEIETIRQSGIVEYCLTYVLSLRHPQLENTTERSTCILATLVSIAERDKEGGLKQLIKKIQKELKELRQHRKRPIRQAARRLLSILQE